MQKYFEKIIEWLEKSKEYSCSPQFTKGIDYSIKIVNNVAEEFATGTNVGSNDGWISCSSGEMPKAHIEVWITYKWDDGSIHVGRDRVIHGEWYCTKREAVIAWKYMKAPAPYQPKGEEV